MKKKIEITEWNILDYLENDKKIASFLEVCLEDNDYKFFMKALGEAIKAHGINEMAKKLGVNRESLYKSFSGNRRPNFETVFKAIKEIGLKINIVPQK